MRHALVGGFFTRPGGVPLGELRTAGIRRPSIAFNPLDLPLGRPIATALVFGPG